MRILRFAQNDRIGGGAAPPAGGVRGSGRHLIRPCGLPSPQGEGLAAGILRPVPWTLYPGPWTHPNP